MTPKAVRFYTALLVLICLVSVWSIVAMQKGRSAETVERETTVVVKAQIKAFMEERINRFEQIRKETEKLDLEETGMVQGRPEELCPAFHRASKYESLRNRYELGDFIDESFGRGISDRMKFAGQYTASLGYAQMKAGKPLGCGGEAIGWEEATVVLKIAEWAGEYGFISPAEQFDEVVVKRAYIRAMRPEIEKMAALFWRYPNDLDLGTQLTELVTEAEMNCACAPEELGVPAWFHRSLP